ncbi:MAG: hypothetical protein R2729_11195 [Bryobacteraceae bacterium]
MAGLALVLGAGYAIGQQASGEKAKKAEQPAAAGEGGVKAYVDPVTKQLRAPEHNEPAIPPQASSRAGVALTTHAIASPRGGAGMMLGPEHEVFSVAKVGADGKVTFECVRGDKAADKAVGEAVSTVKKQGGADVR